MNRHIKNTCLSTLALLAISTPAFSEGMDKMWGDPKTQPGVESSERAALFRDGNYGMFIHWGIYSHLGGQWKDQTFYGIGEWIKRQMKIPEDEYMALAKEFNPVDFDAKEIVRVAREAGMKYIIITSKHHDGFAMFKSSHPFNIVDASPFGRDPMKELSDACREAGLGFGFYYSHNQDWTEPGGGNGPKKSPDGTPANFEQYFQKKCFPQVKEICSNYGELSFVWFDTPGKMPKKWVEQLVELVRETQPQAMLCSRVGHGMGDYLSQGDMEVPPRNAEGLWETCDTTNDSWSYAWYDQNWKDPKEIIHRTVATVGRGGSYLLNVGPDGKGRIPATAANYLIEAGKWIKRNPDVVYAAGPSPWGMALPWGDVTTSGDKLNLVVFDWPQDRRIHLSGFEANIVSAALRSDTGEKIPLKWTANGSWTAIEGGDLPASAISGPANVIELKLKASPKVDTTAGIHPNIRTKLLTEFAAVENAAKEEKKWMEKFGEWKHVTQVNEWKENGAATWEVDVAEAGAYYIDLRYRGEGRPVWKISTDEGVKLQNQQAASPVYHTYPFGIVTFRKPGTHTISVSLFEGDPELSSLESIQLRPTR
jgi:alpha-L-fucosidase